MFKLKVVCIGIAVVVATGAAVTMVRRPGRKLHDFRGQRDQQATSSQEQEQAQPQDVVFAPAVHGQVIDRTAQQKECVANQLLDGHISLLEAAEQFRCLNHAAYAPGLAPLTPGETEDERMCREVLSLARRRLAECYPGAVEELIAPHEEEFRRCKETGVFAKRQQTAGQLRITFEITGSPSR
jgi:hypothetical protein